MQAKHCYSHGMLKEVCCESLNSRRHGGRKQQRLHNALKLKKRAPLPVEGPGMAILLPTEEDSCPKQGHSSDPRRSDLKFKPEVVVKQSQPSTDPFPSPRSDIE